MPAPTSEDAAAFCDAGGKRLHLRRIGAVGDGLPVVFLHEGLGSVDLWRGFPEAVLTASTGPGFVYSRHGNGWSEPLSGPRSERYMHEEALHALPDVLETAGVEDPPVLVGHSDGASIALIHAGSGHPVAGLVLIAPHVFVEQETVAAIAAIRDGFPRSDLAERMGRHHASAETTFYGWADVWLSDGFRTWNIEEYLPAIDAPVLLVQGTEDEYGTMRQLDAIERGVSGPVQRMVVDGAGHSPHLTHGDAVVAAVADFLTEVARWRPR